MKHLVRDTTGTPLLCCWDDCGQYGDDRYKAVGKGDQGHPLNYIFCSTGHLDFWQHSHHDNGNHSPGNRTGFGLIVKS